MLQEKAYEVDPACGTSLTRDLSSRIGLGVRSKGVFFALGAGQSCQLEKSRPWRLAPSRGGSGNRTSIERAAENIFIFFLGPFP